MAVRQPLLASAAAASSCCQNVRARCSNPATHVHLQADPGMASMMANMSGSNQRENMEEKMRALKDDPELAPIMQELEEGGPSAMMK